MAMDLKMKPKLGRTPAEIAQDIYGTGSVGTSGDKGYMYLLGLEVRGTTNVFPPPQKWPETIKVLEKLL